MNSATSRLPEMISSSVNVLTKPSIQTFEQYEQRGTTRDALMYVGIAAALAGLVAFLFNILNPLYAIGALLLAVVGPVVGFFVFAYTLFFMGKQQGGTGTQDEVFYTAALYTAPILAVTGVVGNIPLIGCLFAPVTLVLGIYQLYLGYLASRSSMNLDQNKAIISVVVAVLAQLVLAAIIVGVLTSIFVSVGLATR